MRKKLFGWTRRMPQQMELGSWCWRKYPVGRGPWGLLTFSLPLLILNSPNFSQKYPPINIHQLPSLTDTVRGWGDLKLTSWHFGLIVMYSETWESGLGNKGGETIALYNYWGFQRGDPVGWGWGIYPMLVYRVTILSVLHWELVNGLF